MATKNAVRERILDGAVTLLQDAGGNRAVAMIQRSAALPETQS